MYGNTLSPNIIINECGSIHQIGRGSLMKVPVISETQNYTKKDTTLYKAAIWDSRKHSEKEKPQGTPDQAQRKTIPAGTRPLNTVSTVSPAHCPHPDRVTGPAIVLSILIGPDTKVWLVSQGSTPRDMAQ